MGSKQKERRDGRIMAVQILYTSEVQGKKPLDLLNEGLCLIEEGPLSDFSLAAVRGVQENQAKIDDCLQSISENWTLSRMPMVDLAVLRLAAYEILFSDDVPVSVAINEAVELAKAFGGEDESPRFVNGVLGRLARKLEEDPEMAVPGDGDGAPGVAAGDADAADGADAADAIPAADAPASANAADGAGDAGVADGADAPANAPGAEAAPASDAAAVDAPADAPGAVAASASDITDDLSSRRAEILSLPKNGENAQAEGAPAPADVPETTC
ncbi:transcription antitermination factor NusB [Parvibacter caecicola]|uniref:Transcription antitermination protein NusB n=1 Tax=Parvibacter caecicola TaxID=747645 RepID=A0A7W5D289_9ACTN|nr:transcription antitermination factor NusB [Parvibacter caecicola]MBB3170830.1 N utilization substance protein B [Parvibacter caecicola]MCR2042429.1 transcription antitermination factor NusB [Parvibacter caecicola]